MVAKYTIRFNEYYLTSSILIYNMITVCKKMYIQIIKLKHNKSYRITAHSMQILVSRYFTAEDEIRII